MKQKPSEFLLPWSVKSTGSIESNLSVTQSKHGYIKHCFTISYY